MITVSGLKTAKELQESQEIELQETAKQILSKIAQKINDANKRGYRNILINREAMMVQNVEKIVISTLKEHGYNTKKIMNQNEIFVHLRISW